MAKLLQDPRALLADEWGLRLRAESGMGPDAEAAFLQSSQLRLGSEHSLAVVDALKYASSIEYHHKGLSSRAYLEHPIRVATFVLEEESLLDSDTVVIALIHNLLEVSDVSASDLAAEFGEAIAHAVESLTVDRTRMDEPYKQAYYARLRQGSRSARIVKILDKLDNIFMICFNPDADVRRSYLEEIARWVQPMADTDLPSVAEFLRHLTEVMRLIGYQDKGTVPGISLN
ncbi:MAG: HD domain-containing protein [Sulfuritalea sp.]|nr:HD domain-containing protein [Sulfuritalea sp.]